MRGIASRLGTLITGLALTAFVLTMTGVQAQDAGSVDAPKALSEVKEPRFSTPGRTTRIQRNPFIPPGESEAVMTSVSKEDTRTQLLETMKVSAIMRGDGSQRAIINGYIVRPGDQMREFIIEKIEADRVILKAGDKDYILPLDALVPGLVPAKKGE